MSHGFSILGKWIKSSLDIRSRQLHDQWLSTLPCPILCFEGEYTIEEHLAVLMVERQR